MAMDGARSALNSLPLVGGVFEGIFGSPEKEAHERAMRQSAEQIQAYRPINNQARMNAFQAGANAFGPIQQLMGQMYGPGSQMDLSKIVQNPMPQDSMKLSGAAALPEDLQKDFYKFPKEIQDRILAARSRNGG